MRDIIKSLNDLYAAKLLNWQLEGRDVSSCYKIIEKVDIIEEERKRSLVFGELGQSKSFRILKPLNKEIVNWIMGYCRIHKVDIKIKRECDFWTDKNNIEYHGKEKDFIYLTFSI